MTTPTKLAKSLHTITAIVQVARYYKAIHHGMGLSDSDCIRAAVGILGYDIRVTNDEHGLIEKSLRTLSRTK